MIRKYATATVISAEIATRNPATGLIKASHRAVFNYEPRPGYLYVRSRMISSRCNDNHDEFPAEEIKAAWKTAIGKPAFVNHHNEDHRRMRGVIIDAALHEDTLPDGKPDIWIEALHEIDAKRFPRLAEAILKGRVNRTSMGCDVGHSVCSACGNKASTPAEYCQHIPKMKGKILYRHTASGEREGHLIREKCYKLSFFENSFLVEDPADPTAVVTGIDDRGLKATASKKTAAWDDHGYQSWDQIGERHPDLYGDREVHGDDVQGDGEGIGWAANQLAHDRPDDPGAENHMVYDLEFHPEHVDPKHIDYFRNGSSDSRVHRARVGYESNPEQVPPLVLVHRHGMYQVADGHHRAEAAAKAGKKVRAYVAYSPYPDEPDSDGKKAPYNGAEPHPGLGLHSQASKTAKSWMPEQGQNYHGTHCLMCGENVKYYVKPSQGQHGGMWSHHDGMKRDHQALPADPDKVVNGIPAADAARDQVAAEMRKQLGLPSLRDRDLPPDPFKTASISKEAVPEGIRFHFTPADAHPSGYHHMKATLPTPNGRQEVGYLSWHPDNGMVDMVNTQSEHGNQGIASALWRRAHEVASDQGIRPPRHSDAQSPSGMAWADKVDRSPVVMPGQQEVLPTPTGSETLIEETPRPRFDDIHDHLAHEHGLGEDYVRRARESGSDMQRMHDDQHQFSSVKNFHVHGVKKTGSLRKLSEHWIDCEKDGCGEHWGPHGAAGLLIRHHGEDGQTRYLLQKRAPWVDHGNTWGIPGGALDDDESPHEGAHREAEEEMGELPGLKHHRTHTDDHGNWAYHTVIMDSPEKFEPQGGGDDEHAGHGWFTTHEMKNLDLHPGFAQSLRKVTSMRKKAETHPEAACPSCGSKNFGASDSREAFDPEIGEHYRGLGNLGVCQDCGEAFDATKSYQENLDARNFAKMRGDEFTRGRTEQGELFKNVTPHETEDVLGGHYDTDAPNRTMHERQRQERIRMRGPISHVPFNSEQVQQRQEQILQQSKPYRTPEGPMDKRHLSSRPAIAYNPLADGDWPVTDSLRAEAMAGPKYPDAADHPFYQQHPSHHENIVRTFHEADKGQRAQGMRWYSDAHHIAKAIGKGDAALGAGVLAAYSPKAAWPSNMFNAARSISQGKALGKGEGDGIMQMHANLAQKMLDGEHYSKVLKSPKISDFAHLIEHGGDGDDGQTRVVVDRHALSVATGHRMTTSDLEDAPLGSRHYYDHVASHYRAAAGILTHDLGHPIAPHQVQAVTWLIQQKKNQDADLAQNSGGGKGRVTRDRNSWTRWTEERHHHAPDLDPENLHVRNPHASSLPSVEAYGETKAPADVDTLRTESCPVCGEADSFDGDRCEVCHFIQPPSMFQDPDTGVAKQMDLKKDQLDQGMVGPNGEPIPGVPDPNDPAAMAEGAPGTPGDEIADLFCPACGFSADTQPPMTNNDPAMTMEEGQQGLMEGDVCPECGEATMLTPNDVGEMGGEVPQEVADDADADAMPDDQEPDVDGDGIPDDSEQDADQNGVPDDAEEPQEAPEEVDEDPNAVEDEEEAPKGRKDTTRRASRGHERKSMNKQPKQAATEASSMIAALQQRIAVQDEVLKVAGQQLHYLAKLAGVSSEFEAIKTQGSKKIADIMNPAQPIPDPPSSGPTETTEQAEAPLTYDDPRNPGLTPGSTEHVPAQAVDTPLTPGATLPTSPFNELVDVSQPVAGTETHVDPSMTKIETDVRVGDPMAGAGTPDGTAFPLTGPFAADGAASAGQVTSPGYQNGGRTMASIRLARLRKGAGLLNSGTDELVAAAEIERTAALSDQMIEHEINTLDSLAKSAGKVAGRRPNGGPMPKQANTERRVPSLAGAPEMATTAASSGFGDDDASDLFLI